MHVADKILRNYEWQRAGKQAPVDIQTERFIRHLTSTVQMQVLPSDAWWSEVIARYFSREELELLYAQWLMERSE